MKLYKLEIYRPNHTDEVEVRAEAHTFDNNMIIFWIKNNANEWAMVSAYPTSMTAIVYYDEIQSATNSFNMPETIQFESAGSIEEVTAPTMSAKKRSKK